MISEISCAERIFFEDEFPVIVVQLVELSYNVSRGDWLPALQIRPFWNSGGGFYLWREIDPRLGSRRQPQRILLGYSFLTLSKRPCCLNQEERVSVSLSNCLLTLLIPRSPPAAPEPIFSSLSVPPSVAG